MRTDRLTRVNELLRREISETLFRVMGFQSFDLSAVTVTHVITSSDLRTARVLVSIRNHVDRRDHMLAQLQRHSPEIQRHIADKIILKYTPRLTFALDTSIEAGDHVLDVLAHLDDSNQHAAGPDDQPVSGDADGKQPDPHTTQ